MTLETAERSASTSCCRSGAVRKIVKSQRPSSHCDARSLDSIASMADACSRPTCWRVARRRGRRGPEDGSTRTNWSADEAGPRRHGAMRRRGLDAAATTSACKARRVAALGLTPRTYHLPDYVAADLRQAHGHRARAALRAASRRPEHRQERWRAQAMGHGARRGTSASQPRERPPAGSPHRCIACREPHARRCRQALTASQHGDRQFRGSQQSREAFAGRRIGQVVRTLCESPKPPSGLRRRREFPQFAQFPLVIRQSAPNSVRGTSAMALISTCIRCLLGVDKTSYKSI